MCSGRMVRGLVHCLLDLRMNNRGSILKFPLLNVGEVLRYFEV
jgi:hypothetical protein